MNLLQLMYLTKEATLEQEMMEKQARRLPFKVQNFFRSVERNPSNTMQAATRPGGSIPPSKLPSTTGGVVRGLQGKTFMGMRRKPLYDPKNYLTQYAPRNLAEQKYNSLPAAERTPARSLSGGKAGIGTQRPGGVGFGNRAGEVSQAQRVGSFYNQTSALRDPKNVFLDYMQRPNTVRTERGMVNKLSPAQKKTLGAGGALGIGGGAYGGYQLSK